MGSRGGNAWDRIISSEEESKGSSVDTSRNALNKS